MLKRLLIISLLNFPFFVIGQSQGIKGQVFWLSGNQMPGPEKNHSPQQGVKREIVIYQAIKMSDTRQEDGFFLDLKTEPVAHVFSKHDGSFRIKLPPGQYSVFIKEPKGLFANLFDGQGYINPVFVKAKKFTWITISIDYEAAY